MKIKIVYTLADDRIHLRETVQDKSLQLRHFCRVHPFRLAETVQRTEYKPKGISHAAVMIRLVFQDLLTAPEILGIVGRAHPNAENIRAVVLDNLLWSSHVPERLGHLSPFLVQDEAMG